MYKTSIYVFGGWNGHDTLDDLNEFSVTTKQFYSVPGRGDVPSSRCALPFAKSVGWRCLADVFFKFAAHFYEKKDKFHLNFGFENCI